MEVVHLHAFENVSLVHLARMVRIGSGVFQNDQNVQNFPKFSKMLLLIIDGWSGVEQECFRMFECSKFSKIIEDAHLDGLSGVEQGSSSVENFHGLKPLHLPLMFQKRRGKVWARIFKVSGRGG